MIRSVVARLLIVGLLEALAIGALGELTGRRLIRGSPALLYGAIPLATVALMVATLWGQGFLAGQTARKVAAIVLFAAIVTIIGFVVGLAFAITRSGA
jgi:hypothetical protein